MAAYQLLPDPDSILRTADNTVIPRGHRLWYEYEAWLAAGNIPDPFPATPMPIVIAESCKQIDYKADTARVQIIGDPLRIVEYQRAYAEATDFKNANYTGDVPLTVKSWMDAKAWTAQEAADDILHMGGLWTDALYGLRDIRLKGKEAVRASTDEASAKTATAYVIQLIDNLLANTPKA